jgi:hypothetical protein
MRKIEETLRKLHRELFPETGSDHWKPTEGELVLATHLDRRIEDVVRALKHYSRDRKDSA